MIQAPGLEQVSFEGPVPRHINSQTQALFLTKTLSISFHELSKRMAYLATASTAAHVTGSQGSNGIALMVVLEKLIHSIEGSAGSARLLVQRCALLIMG